MEWSVRKTDGQHLKAIWNKQGCKERRKRPKPFEGFPLTGGLRGVHKEKVEEFVRKTCAVFGQAHCLLECMLIKF